MMIVDSHCHVSTHWFEPVEILLEQMNRNGVTYAVLVQMMGQSDNEYQFEVVRRFPGRFASVVWIDWETPDAASELRRLADRAISGVRLPAVARSHGADELEIWRAAADLGLTVSCIGTTEDFVSEDFARLVQAMPSLRIVIEHLGGEDPRYPNARDRLEIFRLARFPNVFIKVHGLGEFCRRRLPVSKGFPFERPIPPLLDMAYDAFGPGRLMWGSDFPPVSAREGYRNALQLTLEQFAGKNETDQELIFGGVALSLFPVCE